MSMNEPRKRTLREVENKFYNKLAIFTWSSFATGLIVGAAMAPGDDLLSKVFGAVSGAIITTPIGFFGGQFVAKYTIKKSESRRFCGLRYRNLLNNTLRHF